MFQPSRRRYIWMIYGVHIRTDNRVNCSNIMNELIMEQSAPRYTRSVPIGTVKARLPRYLFAAGY
jgi:hypothetical protein